MQLCMVILKELAKQMEKHVWVGYSSSPKNVAWICFVNLGAGFIQIFFEKFYPQNLGK